MRILHYIAITSNSLLALMTLIVLVSVYIPPSLGPYFPLLGFLFPFLIIAHIFFVLFWALKVKKYVWISVVCLILSWPSLTDFIQWNSSYFEQDETDWTIISYNIHHAREIQAVKKAGNWNDQIKAWNQFLKTYPQVDLVCLQENTRSEPYPLPALDELSHRHKCKPRGPSILSRYPILNSGCIDFGNSVNGAIYVDIKGKGTQFRIYNVHLQSNQVSDITQPFLQEDEMSKGQNWEKIKQVFRLYLRAAEQRAAQMDILLQHAKESPFPVIIAGDFNEGPQSYVYRKVEGEYTDSFKEKGRGISSTYAGNIPFLRIDHILHDAHWQTKHHQVFRLPFSDHYPVAASLAFKEKQTEDSR